MVESIACQNHAIEDVNSFGMEGGQVPPTVHQDPIVELEDVTSTLTARDATSVLSQLPAEIQQITDSVVDRSLVTDQKNTLLAIGSFILMSLLLSTFLPLKERQPSDLET